MNKREQILLTSLIGWSLMGWSQMAAAQTKPSCFMTEASGEVVDLSSICDFQTTKRSPGIANSGSTKENLEQPENINNNFLNPNLISEPSLEQQNGQIRGRSTESIYFIGNGEVPFTLGSSSRTYFFGSDTRGNSAYIRRYSTPQTFAPRNDIRNEFFELRANSNSTSRIRDRQTPFVIYRYAKD